MVLVLAATACLAPPPPADVGGWPRVGDTVDVEVTARLGPDLTSAAWSARARLGHDRLPERPARAPDCRAPAPLPPGEPGRLLEVSAPASASLDWQPDSGTWLAAGPRASVDPAWAVGDVTWARGGSPRTAEAAVRFGGVPEVYAVVREDDGDVSLWWPTTEHTVEVRTVGPSGEPLVCAGTATGVRVPWWAVPAGGELVVASTQRHLTIVPDVGVVVVRAVIERVVGTDRPLSSRRGLPLPRSSAGTGRRMFRVRGSSG